MNKCDITGLKAASHISYIPTEAGVRAGPSWSQGRTQVQLGMYHTGVRALLKWIYGSTRLQFRFTLNHWINIYKSVSAFSELGQYLSLSRSISDWWLLCILQPGCIFCFFQIQHLWFIFLFLFISSISNIKIFFRTTREHIYYQMKLLSQSYQPPNRI